MKTAYEVILYYVTHVKAYIGTQDLGRECTALPILFFCTNYQSYNNMKLLKLICKYVIFYYIPIILVISAIIGLFYILINIISVIETPILALAAFWAMVGLAITILYAIIKYFDHD